MAYSNLLEQIEADVAEAERLIAELRLKIALSKSAGENTLQAEQRVQEMVKGWMLLQDERQKALQSDAGSKLATNAGTIEATASP